MARIQVNHKPIRTSPGEHPVGPVLTLDTANFGVDTTRSDRYAAAPRSPDPIVQDCKFSRLRSNGEKSLAPSSEMRYFLAVKD